MQYTPKPIDTSNVLLDSELEQLCEALAENTHEVWAQERIAQGWTYGEHRNDKRKTTPCLLPYAQLPECEKIFDRNTARQVIKVILHLGYRIEKWATQEEDYAE